MANVVLLYRKSTQFILHFVTAIGQNERNMSVYKNSEFS